MENLNGVFVILPNIYGASHGGVMILRGLCKLFLDTSQDIPYFGPFRCCFLLV
jgi:hypothetical protein